MSTGKNRITGSFKAKLGKLETVVDHALAASNEQLADKARDFAPSDTGALRESIGTKKVKDCQYQVTVNKDYAVDVEFGNHEQAAEPFARPAFEVMKSKTLDNVKNAIRKA